MTACLSSVEDGLDGCNHSRVESKLSTVCLGRRKLRAFLWWWKFLRLMLLQRREFLRHLSLRRVFLRRREFLMTRGLFLPGSLVMGNFMTGNFMAWRIFQVGFSRPKITVPPTSW